MKAIVRRGAQLLECDVPEIEPARGQVLVRSLACGICGSDLHAVHQLEELVGLGRRSGAPETIDPNRDLVMGHEFCAEILDFGPATERRLKPGTRVVSVPFIMGPDSMELVGFSTRFPGGFGERMVLAENFLLEVPNGLAPEYAAMVEPMSVGAHAANLADLSGRPVALVIGCGPVGLAVIAALKLRGVGPVMACDYSPERRRLAAVMGADIVVDPAESSPHEHWPAFDVPATLAALGAAQIAGRDVRRPVIFECVGARGVIQAIVETCPPNAQLVVVGVCAEEDRFIPALAINKQMRFDFAFAYSPAEFSATLFDIAEGRVDVAPMFSGIVGRGGVAGAFQALASPNDKVKIIVDPGRA